MDRTIAYLTELGLSEYEGRAYVSLLKGSPATAYEISKHSGIPTSKVYEVLKRLSGKGMISILESDRTRRYIPVEPELFLERYRAKTESVVDTLKSELTNLDDTMDFSSVLNITDYDYLMNKSKQMIRTATRTILLSVWKEELEQMEDLLRDALARDVGIAIIHFGQTRFKCGQVYQHPIEDTLYQEKGGRGLVAVTDLQEVLMGTIFKYRRVNGAWSRNRGFITMAEDYIKHDIYIMKIVKRFDTMLKARFGSRYEKMRDVFSDEELR
jgi:HTH-type transcriptional regulator, sugar sensing transcriptional regulator